MSEDLIRREDAIKAVEERSFAVRDSYTVKAILRNVPSADRPQGEWVVRTHNTLIAQVNFAYCSECGQPIMHEHTRPLWSFCPNCGADMRKESE